MALGLAHNHRCWAPEFLMWWKYLDWPLHTFHIGGLWGVRPNMRVTR